ncbi:MAG: nascent polypeptide-associated complex protein [Candidatus Woesearchaeota archaeon]
MMPGMNQRKMNQMMKKMGVSQNEIDAQEVIIRTGEKELVFNNPQVTKVNMMGQETYQVIGEPEERELKPEISEEDVQTVMEQAQVEEADARKALEETGGDLAEAILNLTNGNQ